MKVKFRNIFGYALWKRFVGWFTAPCGQTRSKVKSVKPIPGKVRIRVDPKRRVKPC